MTLDALIRPIIIPLVAGIACLLMPKRWGQARAWLAIGASVVTLYAAWSIFTGAHRQLDLGEWLLLSASWTPTPLDKALY